MTTCTGCRELLGGYVLSALEPDEAAAVERHLASCPECRAEHSQLEGVPELLALLDSGETAPEQPPRALEEAVLDGFARERSGLQARRPGRRRRLRPRLALTAAAALVVAGVLALAGVFDEGEPDRAFGHARLAGQGAVGNAELSAARAGTGVELSVRGLRGGAGQVYELWCVPDRGRWISGGTFRVDGKGNARVRLNSAARPGDYEVMLVTRRGQRLLRGAVKYY